jgi:acyl carrier protein
MAPKVLGAWHLHAATLDEPLDFFIMFSSAASLIGSPGQSNYVAANAFLDALAHERRRSGLAALSINWGPWSEIGLAARPDRGGRLADQGFASITPEQGLQVLGRLMRAAPTQIGVMPFDVGMWGRSHPAVADSPLFAHLVRERPAARSAARGSGVGLAPEELSVLEPTERMRLVEAFLADQTRRVLGLGEQATLDHDAPLNRIGIDSLMAVELKNRVEDGLGIVLPLAALLKGPSVVQLAGDISSKLSQVPRSEAEETLATTAAARLLDRIDELSDDEVASLLSGLSEESS